jgi:hypothetical protein
MTHHEALAAIVRRVLDEHELAYDEDEPGAFLVTIPGEHKLKTMTWVVVGEHSLHVEAFFIRKPDENHAEFYKWLLERNARMFAVSYAVDNVGDVYLVGRLPLESVTEDNLDRILGSVLTYSDEFFDTALEIGFRSAIEKEWDWRVKRGESLRNLEAFRHFAEPAKREQSAEPAKREQSAEPAKREQSAEPAKRVGEAG